MKPNLRKNSRALGTFNRGVRTIQVEAARQAGYAAQRASHAYTLGHMAKLQGNPERAKNLFATARILTNKAKLNQNAADLAYTTRVDATHARLQIRKTLKWRERLRRTNNIMRSISKKSASKAQAARDSTVRTVQAARQARGAGNIPKMNGLYALSAVRGKKAIELSNKAAQLREEEAKVARTRRKTNPY